MTRKKSRPTHRENAATAPPNEGGFYKMFWNSMDTNQGTNGPNSPSQGDAPVTSPSVVIINDSPADSPCALDEDSCDNLVVPQPIKEEIREDAVEMSDQDSSGETNSENVQESHSGINGNCSSHQTCPPGNPLTSCSKNSSSSPSQQTYLITQEKPPQTTNYAIMTPISTSVDTNASGKASRNEPSTEICFSSDQPQETHHRAEEDGDRSMELIEDNQVCDQVTTEELPETNVRKVVDSNDGPEEISSNDVDLNSNQSHSCVGNSGDTPVSNKDFSHSSSINEEMSFESPICSREIPTETDVVVSDELLSNSLEEISKETPMDVISEPHSPAVSHVNYEETPSDDITDTRFSTVCTSNDVNNEENIVGKSLSLLQTLLNAPDEDLEALSELPDLIGTQHDVSCCPDRQIEGQIMEFESVQVSRFHSSADVSSMDINHSITMPKNILSADGNVNTDISHKNQTNELVDDQDDEFPSFNSNYLPKKIKLDSVGKSRSVRFLKEQVRALYKQYLNDDVILRTVCEPQPPIEEQSESADEVEEAPTFPSVNVYPTPICCVKMERLPDPFVKKSTVAMSDHTFKTWKRQIIRQRNEEKFRHLKVWRRGRTLLWRECELAGMDRATYNEQVAYVNKHELNENSSSDSDSSGDESVHDASSHPCDSSEESSSEEEAEGSEQSSMDHPSSPMKLNTSERQSVTLPIIESETTTDTHLPGDEYVVESTSSSQRSTTKAPAALKITIRKASISKSEDDKEKPTDGEEHFTVPTYPSVHKPRKIATKRTYRRPSDTTPKAHVPPKSTAADTKKSKPAPVEREDLYDQSLLGTRSYEVENFNLLEKWDIPFEEPTLFRSPRAASRLAQLKTKEAFAPVPKRYAPPKTATTVVTKTTTKTTAAPTTLTVSKEVKDVVEMLCSKTVEAMLFPESKSTGKKQTDHVNSANTKAPTTHIQPHEVPSKSIVPSEETSFTLDESSEIAQSETNSTLDASSDFGGSITSLVSEDLPPPKNKSPPKSRRRKRIGLAWCKKKKCKGKATDEQPVLEESSERDEHPSKDISNSPEHSAEQPVSEKNCPENDKSIQEVRASPAHSTQVPVVSEGPGQSPHASEDDSTHRTKEQINKNESDRTVSTEKAQPTDVKMNETLSEELQPNKKVKQDVVPPRLTRSKLPTVELDPELLENFGTRKRKPKADSLNDVSQDEDNKKIKRQDSKKTPQKSKAQSIKPSANISEEPNLLTNKIVDDDSNTQVPEVSEGPGEVALDPEHKQDQENKAKVQEPPVRMLRSRSRARSGNDQKTDKPVQLEADKTIDERQLEEPVVLESPQSPSPETIEPEHLINSRITRSKKRFGPAYVTVKSTDESALPSVCDIVDSIAGQRLPLSKLFDAPTSVASPPTEPITSFRVPTSNIDGTPLIDGKAMTSSSSELGQQPSDFQSKSLDGKPIQPPHEGTALDRESKQFTSSADFGSTNELAGETSDQSNKSIGEHAAPCPPVEENQSAPEVGLTTAALERDSESVGAAASSSCDLTLKTPSSGNVGSASLEVLNIVNSMKLSLEVTSPTKVSNPVSTTSPLLPPPINSDNLEVLPPVNIPPQPLASNILTFPTVSTSSLPTFPTSTQDISSILPGTFLHSLFNSTLDASLTTYSNEMNDSSLADDPGDLVIDESGEADELDVNFFDNLTNADFSDDDLADKIDKIVKDQMHQDPEPVPSLKPKETGANSSDDGKKAQEESSSKSLNRRDSIDERTGLPNNLIQRLRDPRIRSRLLSHLEEVETNDKTPQSSLAPLQNSLPVNDVTSSTVGDPEAARIGNTDSWRNLDGVAMNAVSCPTVTSTVISCPSSQVPMVSPALIQPVIGVTITSSGIPGQPLAVPNTPVLTTPLVQSGTSGQQPLVTQETPMQSVETKPEEPPDPSQVDFLVPPSDDEEEECIKRRPTKQQPLVTQETPMQSVENSDKTEEPPDPSQVDFLVPPSDDEEEECIKRRPKKTKKEVDVELMYKSPLEDLQSEARPVYGERAPRRYGENFPRRRSGDGRRSRWDDRRSRIDDQRDSQASRDRSRDRMFNEHGRDQSRDQRTFYDRPPRSQSRDRRAYDPYPYSGREHLESPYHVDMQSPYHPPSSPWLGCDPAFNHHQGMIMQHSEVPHWQQNYYPQLYVPPHPPIFAPEPPKIDYMETRLINLELLPKTTNLDVPSIKKVYSYFNREDVKVLKIPAPAYDLNDQPHTIQMVDPVTEEMIQYIQTPRPTSGLTKKYFRGVPPDLRLDDVVKYHFISPAYVMVHDNEEDLDSSSDEEDEEEEEDESDAKYNEKLKLHHRKQESKSVLEHKKRVSKPSLEQNQKRESRHALEHHQKRESKLPLEHHQQQNSEPESYEPTRPSIFFEHREWLRESVSGNDITLERSPVPDKIMNDPLQNILQNLPLLREQFSLQKSQPPADPIPPPPPPPEWNDVDLRISRVLAAENEELSGRNPSPPSERSSKKRSRSRSRSPYRSRRSRSPRRRRRSRSRSSSFKSDMSISPTRSRSRSRSPAYSRRGSRTPRRRRSRSRSSELSHSRRSSSKRHSTSISPPRKNSKR